MGADQDKEALMSGEAWHYEQFDHQARLGPESFGADWPFLEKLASVKTLGGMHVRINTRVRQGQPQPVKYPIMSSFTGSYDVMQMHPQDFAWFMIGTKHWEYAHALSMRALEWLIQRNVDLALAHINQSTKTEWDEYMEETYGEDWYEDLGNR